MARQDGSRREFWLTHLRQWRAQGGTMKAYAQANGLSVGNFYAAKSAHARRPGTSQAPRQVPESRVTLLPVRLAPAPTHEPMRVHLPNGVRIEVPAGVDAGQWRSLLDALGQGR